MSLNKGKTKPRSINKSLKKVIEPLNGVNQI